MVGILLAGIVSVADNQGRPFDPVGCGCVPDCFNGEVVGRDLDTFARNGQCSKRLVERSALLEPEAIDTRVRPVRMVVEVGLTVVARCGESGFPDVQWIVRIIRILGLLLGVFGQRVEGLKPAGEVPGLDVFRCGQGVVDVASPEYGVSEGEEQLDMEAFILAQEDDGILRLL